MEIEAARIIADAITGAVNGLQLTILGWVIVYIALNIGKMLKNDNP